VAELSLLAHVGGGGAIRAYAGAMASRKHSDEMQQIRSAMTSLHLESKAALADYRACTDPEKSKELWARYIEKQREWHELFVRFDEEIRSANRDWQDGKPRS
jgi:hypothetical protein